MTSPTPAPQRILLTGSNGQIGTVLAAELRATYGAANVVCSDIAEPSAATLAAGPFERLNVLDADALREVIRRHGITTVYHLSAVLSAPPVPGRPFLLSAVHQDTLARRYRWRAAALLLVSLGAAALAVWVSQQSWVG